MIYLTRPLAALLLQLIDAGFSPGVEEDDHQSTNYQTVHRIAVRPAPGIEPVSFRSVSSYSRQFHEFTDNAQIADFGKLGGASFDGELILSYLVAQREKSIAMRKVLNG